MLSRTEAHQAAAVLLDRLGDVAIAAAMFRAQQAGARKRYEAMRDWRLIAEAAQSRTTPDGPSGS